MRKPCLDCGQPADRERCETCAGIFDRGRYQQQTATRKARGGRPQYSGGWAAYAKAVRQSATICAICGDGPKHGDPWQADHITPAARGGGTGAAQPTHRSCNVGRGNRDRVVNLNERKRNMNPAHPPHMPHPPAA